MPATGYLCDERVRSATTDADTTTHRHDDLVMSSTVAIRNFSAKASSMRINVKQSALVRVVVPLIAFALLAGCSSSSGNSASTTSTPKAKSSAPSQNNGKGAANGTSGTKAKPIDVCTVVDAAKAKSLSGWDITSATKNTQLMANEYGCNYSNDASDKQFEISVFEHDATTNFSVFQNGSKNATNVSGVGGKAFWDNDGTLYVLNGNALIQVNGLDNSDTSVKFANLIVAAL